MLGYFAYDEVRVLGERASSVNIAEGDRVEVIEEVMIKGGVNAKGMQGTVIDAWVICETDPACCCAELATDAPLTVRLDAPCMDGIKELVGYFSDHEVAVVGRAAPSSGSSLAE